jgi:hypothetical protein
MILPGNVGGVVGTQFTSPAVVGAGTEFTGTWLFAGFGMTWDIAVDLAASSFSVSFAENTAGNNNISDGPQMLGISLTDLDPFGTGTITNVTQAAGNPFGVASIASTADTITIFWQALPFGAGNTPPVGGTYNFNITAAAPVPAPATLLLLGVGLAALGLRRRASFCWLRSGCSPRGFWPSG